MVQSKISHHWFMLLGTASAPSHNNVDAVHWHLFASPSIGVLRKETEVNDIRRFTTPWRRSYAIRHLWHGHQHVPGPCVHESGITSRETRTSVWVGYPHWVGDNIATILDDIFCMQNCCISNQTSPISVPNGPVNNKSPILLIRVWRRRGEKPLSVPMMA